MAARPYRRAFLALFVFGSFVIGVMACANVLGIEDRFFNADASDSASDAPDDRSNAPADATDETVTGPCPPKMISTGLFCIDSHEVSQRDYAAFLAATGADAGHQIPACVANSSLAPGETCKPFSFSNVSDFPMACVDWCDAHAYCAWAGKRLCGLVDGGAVPFDLLNTTSDQWFAACSRQADGLHKYPYGAEYEAGICNTKEYDAGAPVQVGSAQSCVGGYPGLHDMSGNVWEWEDSCRSSFEDAGQWCIVRGGSYTTGGDFIPDQLLSCSGRYEFNGPTATNPDTGFRCCSR